MSTEQVDQVGSTERVSNHVNDQNTTKSFCKIIGFSGSFGAGKSSRAEYLASKIKNAKCVNFADALKEMVKQHFHLDVLDKNAICEKYGITYGQVLQKYGQGMRDIDPDFWLDKVKWLVTNEYKGRVVVIGDVRHQNELDWILESGGMVFQKLGSLQSSFAGRDINHPSEDPLEGYTMIFDEYSSIEDDCNVVLKLLSTKLLAHLQSNMQWYMDQIKSQVDDIEKSYENIDDKLEQSFGKTDQ